MSLGAIFAMLLSSGACGPVDLPRADGIMTRVIVCPALTPIPADMPADKRKPANCGEVAFDSRDGERLTVGVCAALGAAPPPAPEATEPDSTPALPGQKRPDRMPRAYGESIGVILRLYNRDDATPREPFDKVLFVKGDLGVAHLSGLRDDHARDFLAPAWRREIGRELRAHGFHTAIWYRIKDGKRRKYTIDLTARAP